MKKLRVETETFQRRLVRILKPLGYSDREAREVVTEFINNELIGKNQIGLKVFKRLVGYNKEQVKTPIEVSINGNIATVDAGGRFAHSVAQTVINILTKKTNKMGVCIVGIKNNTSFLKAGYLVKRLVDLGYIGISFMYVDVPFSSPTKIRKPLFGTNPIAIGIPCGQFRLLYDSSTTAISGGKKKQMEEASIYKLQESIGLNNEGKLTNILSETMSVLPLGGDKGFGLLLAMEMLAGSLLGYQIQNKNGKYHADNGILTIAIDPKKFGNAGMFEQRNERLLSLLKKESKGKLHIPGDDYSALKRSSKYMYVSKDTLDEILKMG